MWTSGVKKIRLVNLFFLISLFILIIYLLFSTFITPLALNKSRNLLSKDGYNSILPTIRIQQFSDSFKGFTFLVEQRLNNEIKNVFLHDKSNILKNLTSNSSDKKTTTIIAKEGIVEEKRMILFNGNIITTNSDNTKSDLIKFTQLNIDLTNLQTSTIKVPKLQETPTSDLLRCVFTSYNEKILNCKKNTKKEITTVLNRRIVLPFFIYQLSPLYVHFY